MGTFTGWLFCVYLVVLVTGQAHDDDDLSTSSAARLKPDSRQIAKLCKDRPDGEYFRLSTEGSCREVVRCDQAGTNGAIRLAGVKCPYGLAFDIFKQTCDWKGRVNNCDKLEKPRKVLPNLVTDEPVCPDGKLQCGNGECIEKALFCDDKPDCSDGSDENACTVETDPNRAPECDQTQCVLPDCFCSADGTRIPGALEPNSVPQMITYVKGSIEPSGG